MTKTHPGSLVGWVVRAPRTRLQLLEAIAASPGATAGDISRSIAGGRRFSEEFIASIYDLTARDLVWLADGRTPQSRVSITLRGKNILAKARHAMRSRSRSSQAAAAH
jgi:hypothetical protein